MVPVMDWSNPFDSYEEYLQYFNNQDRRNLGSAESGDNTPRPLERWQWDDPDVKKWDLLGNGFELTPGTPRYEEVKRRIAATPGLEGSDFRNIMVSRFPAGVDPKKTINLGDGTYAWSHDNSYTTPDSEHWKTALAGIGAVVGGGMLANGFGAGFGAGGADLGLGASEIGTAAAGGAPEGLFGGFGGLDPETWALNSGGGPPSSYWNMTANAGNIGTDAGMGEGWNGLFGETGGLDPNTLAGQGGMGVAQNGIGPGSMWNQLQGAFNNPSSLMGGEGLLGRAGQWVLNNPLDALRVAAGAGSLINAAGGGGGGRSGGGGGGGIPWQNGPMPTFNPQLGGAFQQNPYLMQQMMNVPFMRGY